MGGLGASHCPLCRAEFKHFAAICKPLHAYIVERFPTAAAERDAQTKEQERDEWNAESPNIILPSGVDPLDGFKCCGCGDVAAPPAVLSCGHIVCARPGGWPSCPVDGCVGTSSAVGTSLAVCGLIGNLLRTEHPGYEDACARPCAATASGAVPTAAATADATASSATSAEADGANDDGELRVGMPVELHSLSSAAGQALNGMRGTVEAYDDQSERFVVVAFSGTQARRVRAKAANLRRIIFPYIHFGVGCDGCGVFPIEARRFRCVDCSEAIGFDMCGRCFDKGVHLRSDAGRFNQQHRPDHRMEEMPQVDTGLHQLQRAHPELTVEQIMQRVQLQDEVP